MLRGTLADRRVAAEGFCQAAASVAKPKRGGLRTPRTPTRPRARGGGRDGRGDGGDKAVFKVAGSPAAYFDKDFAYKVDLEFFQFSREELLSPARCHGPNPFRTGLDKDKVFPGSTPFVTTPRFASNADGLDAALSTDTAFRNSVLA